MRAINETLTVALTSVLTGVVDIPGEDSLVLHAWSIRM